MVILRRNVVYISAILLRIILGALFVDRNDFATFTETGNDILNLGTSIYASASLHRKFRYFPLAYLAVLPGQALYYLQPIRDIRLQRVFLKLPLILADIWLACMFRNSKFNQNDHDKLSLEENDQRMSFSELFILFNPILIYAGSIKGQFDVIPGILLLYSWRFHNEGSYTISGLCSGAAILFKQYCAMFSLLLVIALLRNDKRNLGRHILGVLTIFIPTLILGAVINLDAMIERAILYHVRRRPGGYSLFWLTSIVLEAIGYDRDSSILPRTVGMGTVATVLIVLFLSFWLLKSPETQQKVLQTFFLSFAALLILKVFHIHYLAAIIPLWTQYRRETRGRLTMTELAWAISLIPLTVSIRVNQMTPPDTRLLFGEDWLLLIWIIGVLSHVALVLIFRLKNTPLYQNKWIIVVHILGLTLTLPQFLF